MLHEFGWFASVAGVPTAGSVGSLPGTMAVGPGGVLALSDKNGAVGRYHATIDEVTDWSAPVIAVDVDALIRPYIAADGRVSREPESVAPADRAAAARQADAQVGAVLAKLPPSTTVLVAGLADHGSVPPICGWR